MKGFDKRSPSHAGSSKVGGAQSPCSLDTAAQGRPGESRYAMNGLIRQAIVLLSHCYDCPDRTTTPTFGALRAAGGIYSGGPRFGPTRLFARITPQLDPNRRRVSGGTAGGRNSLDHCPTHLYRPLRNYSSLFKERVRSRSFSKETPSAKHVYSPTLRR